MKKIVSILICVLLMVSLVAPVFATEEAENPTVVTVTADKTSVAKGDEVTFVVDVRGTNKYTNINFYMIFDPEEYQLVRHESYLNMPDWFPAFNSTHNVYAFIDFWAKQQGTRAYEGAFFQFTLKALVDCPAAATVDVIVKQGSTQYDAVVNTPSFAHNFGALEKIDDDNHGYTCTICGAVESEAHTWVDGEVTKAPSCKEEGAQAQSCECGATKTKVLPKTEEHTEKLLEAKAPTCTETGLTEGKYCSVCEKVLVEQEVIKENGHTEETVPGKAATCTATGLTDGKKCSVCEKVLAAQEEIPVVPHTEEVIPGKAATCTETGLTDGKKCSVCEKILAAQEEIPVVPHTEETIPAVDATCTETGLTAGVKCSVCEKILDEQDPVPALGHKDADKDEFCDVCEEDLRCKHPNTEVIPGKEATCSATGLTEGKKCSDCGDILVKQEEIAKKPHTEEVIPGKAATCTATGMTDGKKCSVCGETLVAQEEIAKKPHTEEVVPGKAATCTATGLTDGKKCSVCGETLVAQEEIPVVPHTEEVVPGKAATCTETGLTDGKKCSVCEKILIAQEEIPVVPHTEETIPAVDATCTETGLTAGVKCSVCEKILDEQDPVPALGHKDADKDEFCDVCEEDLRCKHTNTEVLKAVEATCTETGLTEGKKCSDCGDILVKQEIVPVVPHEFAETWKADETNHWHECVCGEKADVAEHVFTEGDLCDFCKFERDHVHRLSAVEAAEATCEKAGNKAHYACSGCEEWFEDAQGAVKITDKSLFIIEKLPHNDADNDQFCDDCKSDLRPPVVPEEPKDDEFKTGDSSNMMLWSALLVLSAMGAAACVITGKKKYNV